MSKSAKAHAATHEEGRAAYANGVGLRQCPYNLSLDAASRYWQEGWRYAQARAAEAEKADKAEAKVRNVVDAIEAFTDAKIAYERRRISDPEWASSTDVNETRDHLAVCLGELAS